MAELSNDIQGMEVEAPAREPLVDAGGGPPAHWTKIADWSNIIAGITLMMAFFLGALINNVQLGAVSVAPGVPSPNALFLLRILFCVEGALYAIGGFYMCGIMACIPPPIGGGPAVMQFVILTAGGIFFGFSGLAFPPCIVNIRYLFSPNMCTHIAAGGIAAHALCDSMGLESKALCAMLPNGGSPYVYNAVAHYGITCFMIGTAIGFKGVLGIPAGARGAFGTGPFWGSTMFFLGAWTIGIFQFWGPMLAGGFGARNEDPQLASGMLTRGFDYNAPAASYTFQWWFALLGSGFLTYGAIIFGKMNGTI